MYLLIYTLRGQSVTRQYTRRSSAHRAVKGLRVRYPSIAAYWIIKETETER